MIHDDDEDINSIPALAGSTGSSQRSVAKGAHLKLKLTKNQAKSTTRMVDSSMVYYTEAARVVLKKGCGF
jgi:hypothetical protein